MGAARLDLGCCVVEGAGHTGAIALGGGHGGGVRACWDLHVANHLRAVEEAGALSCRSSSACQVAW